VNGTLAVLNAAKAAGTVERLILTSSVAAIADEFEPGKVRAAGRLALGPL
jgi:nucleoside-diphosphate-sugar epimerase